MNITRISPILLVALAACSAQPEALDQRLATWDRLQEERAAAEQLDYVAPSGELTATSSGAQVDAIDVDLHKLLQHARANNPGLEAAFEQWKQSLEEVPQATAMPNPRLSFSGYLSEVETRVGPMQARVGLAQPFPWFGKRELRGDVAFEASEAARETLEAVRLELDQRVREAWYEYAYVQQALQISEGNRELLKHWESVARARMETGLGSHADVIRAQVELGKLEDRVQTLSDYRRPLVAQLNAALDRPADAGLPEPSYPLPEPPALDEELLASGLAASSPVLRALEHRVEAAKHGVDLAAKSFYPDFFIGADYTFIGSAANPGVPGSGDDALALTLGVDLPIWRSSYRAGERAAESRTRSARQRQVETLNQLSAELEMALYQVRDASRRVELFQGSLVPKGEESLRALDIAYQGGDEGFLDLIDSQRVLLEFQLQAARAAADRAKALARTERITGISLNLER
jgi:outer membrane protein, heavy metal efflux system